MFSTVDGLHRITDIAGDTNKEGVNILLNAFQRNRRMDGIVESVTSGSRSRIRLLKANYIISLIDYFSTC